MIDKLRQYLKRIESKLGYPAGIVPFPKILVGQGFFPGGDGLWREKNKLKERSELAFPIHGIMSLGNDFGTLGRFEKLKQYENPPTWQRLRKRLELAGIPGEIGFFTNAYLGLRTDRSALADPINKPKEYEDLCKEFLSYQISVQKPRLIVVLGDRPAALLQRIVSFPRMVKAFIQSGNFNGKNIFVLIMSHPYSDVGKSREGIESEAKLLAEAWQQANRITT